MYHAPSLIKVVILFLTIHFIFETPFPSIHIFSYKPLMQKLPTTKLFSSMRGTTLILEIFPKNVICHAQTSAKAGCSSNSQELQNFSKSRTFLLWKLSPFN